MLIFSQVQTRTKGNEMSAEHFTITNPPNIQVYPHIYYYEARCRCYTKYSPPLCLGGGIHWKIAGVFGELREACGGNPIVITSGYRCPRWNEEVGGVRNSHHLRGLALDMHPPEGYTVEEFAQVAHDLYGVGVLIYSTFIHVDMGTKRLIDFRQGAVQ